MTTVREIRRRMYSIGPAGLGEVWPIASGSGTTIVVTALKDRPFSAGYFDNKYLVRSEAASPPADYSRSVKADGFASATGTLTTDVTMADATFTSENVEIASFSPQEINLCINHALRRIRMLDVTEIPATIGRHWLDALTWVNGPGEIERITWTANPQISRNRYFQKWNSYSSGSLIPDDWTLSGSGATIARNTFRTSASVEGVSPTGISLTRSGTDAVLTQNLSLRLTGVSADSYAGDTLTAVLRGVSGAASSLRIRITDGVDTTNSSYHTGGGTIEEMTAQHTVNASPVDLQALVLLETDETPYLDEAYVVFGSLQDAMRRNDYPEYHVWSSRYEQAQTNLPAILPARQKGSHYRVYSWRPYPDIDESRIQNGTADADTVDAPIDVVAAGALSRLYEREAQREGTDATRNRLIAADWERRFQNLALRARALPPGGKRRFQRMPYLAPASR